VIENQILIVDDDEDIRNLFSKIFSDSGYEVVVTEDAEEAIEVLKKNTIQVMFLDLGLPRMNGIDLCNNIRKKLPNAVIHAVTAYSTLYEVAECYEAGFDDYFEKPIGSKILLEAARSAFEKIERQLGKKNQYIT